MLPIFSSHHSIGSSLLTLDKEDEINEEATVSLLALAKTHGLKEVVLVDEYFSGYWRAFELFKDSGIQLIYGLKLSMIDDSKVIIIFNNSQAYYDAVPLYTDAFTIGDGKSHWGSLQKFWTPNLSLLIPFYSSFLARNLLILNHAAVPSFGAIKPTFLIQQQGLPWDVPLKNKVLEYCEANKYDTMDAMQIYYHLDRHVENLCIYKCITNREPGRSRTLQKPELPGFSSHQFSFESYLVKSKDFK